MSNGEVAEFKRCFKKIREEKVKRGVELKFFGANNVEVGGVVLFKCLLNGLSNTKMAFCGGKD